MKEDARHVSPHRAAALPGDARVMIPPDAQRFFAKRMGATVTSLAGRHASMVPHPDAVAVFIMKAAQAASSRATAGARQ